MANAIRLVHKIVVLSLLIATFAVASAGSAQAVPLSAPTVPLTVPLSCSSTEQYIHVSGGQVVFKSSRTCNQLSPHHRITAYLWNDGGAIYAQTTDCWNFVISCNLNGGTGLRVPCANGQWYANSYHSAENQTGGLPWQSSSSPGNSGSWMSC